MGTSLTVRIGNKQYFFCGIGLVALGVCLPLLLHVGNFGIYRDLAAALDRGDKILVLAAALKLVGLNIIRGFPHYLGAFYAADAVSFTRRGRPVPLLRACVLFPLIVSAYLLIGALFGIRYDFGVPAALMVFMLLILIKIDFSMVSGAKKALMVFFLLCSMQCLDVMPALSGLPFGHGETSYDIKSASTLLDADGPLQYAMTLLFLILLANTALIIALIRDENRRKAMALEKEQRERLLVEARLRALESRTYGELNHLAHDLKTPLTSMQALVGVAKLAAGDGRVEQYLADTEDSIQRMSLMISEFLDETKSSPCAVGDLVNDLLAQVSNTAYAPMLTARVEEPGLMVRVNKVRFLRMLVNLIENAWRAVDPETGMIELSVYPAQGRDANLCFEVRDNGRGMDPTILDAIWEAGFSASGSHGLGLSFVKQVVERHGGSIRVESAPGRGTVMRVTVPREGKDDE